MPFKRINHRFINQAHVILTDVDIRQGERGALLAIASEEVSPHFPQSYVDILRRHAILKHQLPVAGFH
ncbi:hypothetical protein D9M68_880060 [compost metagenome]